MTSSLSSLFEFIEGTHEIKCKDFDCFLEYPSVKDIFKQVFIFKQAWWKIKKANQERIWVF